MDFLCVEAPKLMAMFRPVTVGWGWDKLCKSWRVQLYKPWLQTLSLAHVLSRATWKLNAESLIQGIVIGSIRNGFIVSCARRPKTEMAKIKTINILFMICNSMWVLKSYFMFWPFRDFFILPNLLMPRHNRDIAPMPVETKGKKTQQLRVIIFFHSWMYLIIVERILYLLVNYVFT